MPAELKFCGENRKSLLRKLKSAYDALAAAAAQTRAQKQPALPPLRVILVEAERGLGKTRTVMELFRHLTTACDPDGYWPDSVSMRSDSFDVMPRAESCNFAAKPPFLWWGMAIADGPSPGNTVFATLEDILPHLLSAELAKRRAQSGRDFILEAGDLAFDLGIDLAEDLSFIGTAKRLGVAALKIGALIKRQYSDPSDPLALGQDRTESVVASVMADLGRLMDPRSRHFIGIPLVVFVDDAQFADKDPAMAAFCERLLARAVRENWPVLVIFTHWSRQLRSWTDASGREHRPSHIARLLDHARSASTEQLGEFAGEPGGFLSADAVLHIDLSDPVEGLEAALRGQFPGLSADDVAAIVDKSGGNPRKLEQIIARIARKPRWFESNDPARAFTQTGRDAALALSDLPIEEVVLERFADTPGDARRSMILASMLGNRFVVDLVERLATTRVAVDVRGNLEEGERSYRFLRDVLDRSRNDVASFAERLFYNAAQEYRESGMAQQSLPDLPPDDDVMGALDELLLMLMRDPSGFPNLGDDDLAEALTLAARRMEATGRSEAGLALARLVSVENGRGNPEGGYAAALRFIDGFTTGWMIDAIPSAHAHEVADTLLRLGRSDDALRIWSALAALQESDVKKDPSNSQWQNSLARTYDRLGDLDNARGDAQAALAHFKAACGIRERLVSIESSDSAWQNNVAVSYNRLGVYYEARGDRKAALGYYAQAAGILLDLAARFQDDLNFQHGLSVIYRACARLNNSHGNIEAALGFFLRSRAIMERLAAAAPSDSEWQSGLASIDQSLGAIHTARDEHDQALQRYNTASDILAKLTASDPSNTHWQQTYCSISMQLGVLHTMRGESDVALAFSRTACGVAERLVSLDPANTGWQATLFKSYLGLVNLHYYRGERDAALAQSKAMLAHAQEQAAINPSATQQKLHLSAVYLSLVELLTDRKAYETAFEHCKAGLSIAEELVSTDPSNTEWQSYLSLYHAGLGDLYNASGDRDATLASFTASVAIAKELVSNDPSNNMWHYRLSVILGKLGVFYARYEDKERALEFFKSALDITKRLATIDPNNPQYQRDHGVILSQLGDMHHARGQKHAALACFRDAIAIKKPLTERDPSQKNWQCDLASSYVSMGVIHTAYEETGAAVDCYSAAYDIHKRLAAIHPSDMELRYEIIRDMLRLAGVGDRPREHYTNAIALIEELAGEGRWDPSYDWLLNDLREMLVATGN